MSSLDQLNLANAVSYYMDRHLQEGRGDKIAFYYQEEALTYAELYELSGRAANVFDRAGVSYENRVALILPDCTSFVAAFFGLLRLGAVPVPLSPRLAFDDYLYVLADCRPAGAVITQEHLPAWERMREEFERRNLPFPHSVWAADADQSIPPHQSFEASLKSADAECRVRATSADDMALIQYTSGSTGIPKGVVHLHRGLLAVCENIVQRLGVNEEDICFSAAKLSFGYGLGNSVLFPLGRGASSVLFPGLADPYSVYDIIRRHRPTVFFGVPSLYSAILNVPHCGEEFDLSCVRLCVSAGEHLSARLFQRWKSTFGHEIVEGIGATECLHIFICGEAGRVKPGSTGTLIGDNEARLVDEQDVPVGAGDAGRLYVKSKYNAARYWNKQEETLNTMVGRWTRTGDLLYRDAEGHFYYVGREDDVIKIGGMKVSPAEIEECLSGHESVRECAVVGSAAEDGTVTVTAFVCLRDGREPSRNLSRELKDYMRGLISPYKVPRVISFVTELPRTTTGKVARFKLR